MADSMQPLTYNSIVEYAQENFAELFESLPSPAQIGIERFVGYVGDDVMGTSRLRLGNDRNSGNNENNTIYMYRVIPPKGRDYFEVRVGEHKFFGVNSRVDPRWTRPFCYILAQDNIRVGPTRKEAAKALSVYYFCARSDITDLEQFEYQGDFFKHFSYACELIHKGCQDQPESPQKCIVRLRLSQAAWRKLQERVHTCIFPFQLTNNPLQENCDAVPTRKQPVPTCALEQHKSPQPSTPIANKRIKRSHLSTGTTARPDDNTGEQSNIFIQMRTTVMGRISELLQELKLKNEEIETARKSEEALRTQHLTCEWDMQGLKRINKKLTSEHTALQAENTALKDQVEEVQTKLQTLRGELGNCKTEKVHFMQENEKLLKIVENVTSENERLLSEIQGHEAEHREWIKDKEQWSKEKAKGEKDMQDMIADIAALPRDLEELQAK